MTRNLMARKSVTFLKTIYIYIYIYIVCGHLVYNKFQNNESNLPKLTYKQSKRRPFCIFSMWGIWREILTSHAGDIHSARNMTVLRESHASWGMVIRYVCLLHNVKATTIKTLLTFYI